MNGASCTHLDQIAIVNRDSSPNRHASRHAAEDGHPLARSAEPGESWAWCYVDDTAIDVASAVDAP